MGNLKGESPEHAKCIAEGKGVLADEESEGSRKQISGLTNRNHIRRKSVDKVALEKEVYLYNYKTDEFTYLHYYDSGMISKTVINVGSGAIIADNDGYADLLTTDAQELKNYFFDLLGEADLEIEELHN